MKKKIYYGYDDTRIRDHIGNRLTKTGITLEVGLANESKPVVMWFSSAPIDQISPFGKPATDEDASKEDGQSE